MTALRVVFMFLFKRKALARPRGLRRRLSYEFGYLRFLWRAETGQIGFLESELAQLASKVNGR